MIQVRLILQPVTVEKSAPILLYGNFFRFSTDHMIASDNGGDVFVPADGVDMFILLRHRREDGRQMGDIVSLDSVIQVVDLFPQFGPYFLGPSPSFSGFPVTFLPVPNHFRVFYDYFHPFRLSPLSSDCSVICPFHVFRLFPSISLFRLISFQFSILGSDRSESGSLLSICLHFCSATIPFSVDLRVLLFFDLMTSVSPSNYDPFLIVLFCI